MVFQKFSLTGQQLIIEKLIIYLLVMEFYLIMSHQEEVKLLFSKKITKGVANIFKKKQSILYLGNLNAKRDWGHARTMSSHSGKYYNKKIHQIM